MARLPKRTTVYVKLLDEGIDVWRPAPADALGQNRYRLQPTDDYDPVAETWEFPPGTIVISEPRRLDAGVHSVAIRGEALDEATRSRSLAELEDDLWPTPEYDSYLVREAHRLRNVPIGDLTVEDLRLLIGQGIGIDWLIPIALDVLIGDPLVPGDMYPGDLLNAVLGTDPGYWSAQPKSRSALRGVRLAVESTEHTADGLPWPQSE